MTLDMLKQYRKNKNAIKIIDSRIDELHYKYDEYLFDTVVGSTPRRPDAHIIPIRGYGSVSNPKIGQRISELEKRKHVLCRGLGEVERFMASISNKDVEVWQILQLKYMGDRERTWSAVAREVYGHPCGDKTRMMIKRFLEKF